MLRRVMNLQSLSQAPRFSRPERLVQARQTVRVQKDRVTGTKKAIFGEEEILLELFEEHTAYVERTHLTMRQMNSRLIRGLASQKSLQCTGRLPAGKTPFTT